jgi:hypothetical protein
MKILFIFLMMMQAACSQAQQPGKEALDKYRNPAAQQVFFEKAAAELKITGKEKNGFMEVNQQYAVKAIQIIDAGGNALSTRRQLLQLKTAQETAMKPVLKEAQYKAWLQWKEKKGLVQVIMKS